MIRCDNCGATFDVPDIMRENPAGYDSGYYGPQYVEYEVCPFCGDMEIYDYDEEDFED